MNLKEMNRHPRCTPELERKMMHDIDSQIKTIAEQAVKTGTTESAFQTNKNVVLTKIRELKNVCGLNDFGNNENRAFDERFRYYKDRVRSNGIDDAEE